MLHSTELFNQTGNQTRGVGWGRGVGGGVCVCVCGGGGGERNSGFEYLTCH